MGAIPEAGGVIVEEGMSYLDASSACLSTIEAASQTGIKHYVGVVLEAGMTYMDVCMAMVGC